MGLDVILLVVSLGIILLASIIFTNAIEMLGHRLGVHQGVAGSVLAAVGTALPETVIPIIAILSFRLGHNGTVGQSEGVAIGAIAGAPFMLATLAFFVTGVAVVAYRLSGRRTLKMTIDHHTLGRDLGYFVIIYAIAIATSFVHEQLHVPGRVAVGVFLLAAYIVYLKKTFAHEGMEMEEVEVLYFSKLLRIKASTAMIVLQVAVSLGLMIFGAHQFVSNVKSVSTAMGIPTLVLSLIITPVATELPEKLNSVIWIRARKDMLALGNMSGAMVFQSSFPVMFGIIFTDWDLKSDHGVTLVSAALALLSAGMILAWVRARKSINPFILLAGGAFYAAFLVYVFVIM